MGRCMAEWIGAALLVVLAGAAGAQTFSWQQPHAKVLPTGDLEWAPRAFVFEAGDSVRYIDFEGGDDSNDGLTKRTPWKHHPWDPNATGRAAACKGVHTYVFKRGVYYRGALYADESGRSGNPIRLTSDPSWGEGEAVLCGSELIKGWKKGADRPEIPEREKVWWVDLDFAPRNVWMVDDDGTIVRIKLARTPNWEVVDPDDIKSQWWTWKNPKKPFDNYMEIAGGRRHLAFDPDHINTSHPQDYYEGALLWTTKGWVMGSPFPTRVMMVDRDRGAMAFRGQWGGTSYKIIRGCRYYLEDKPHYLDEPGEFWFDRKGEGGRLYIRLPGERDPNRARVEVAKRIHVIESTGMSHIRISGLTFRFTNVYWRLTASPWWVSHESKDVEPACVRLLGPGRDIRIANCRFEYVHMGVRMKPEGRNDVLDDVEVSDNLFRRCDYGAVHLADGTHWGVVFPPFGRLGDVRVMRNKCEWVGFRPDRFAQGVAIDVRYPTTAEVAGNVVENCASQGVDVLGAKPSGAVFDRPLSRLIIHHNKVVNSLLNNDDFGGIETWQGGPAYVYDNISGNPGGYRNWDHVLSPEDDDRFGHAYYLDGAFKNYHFNNIAWGKSKGPAGPLANTAAFQEIHSYQNTFFNNTIYNFVRGSRRQAPQAGRDKFLGNVWQSIGLRVFRHSDPARTRAAGNEADAGPQKTRFAIQTNAYARNVFYDLGETFATLEPSGQWLDTLEQFREVLSRYGPLADEVGVIAGSPPLPKAVSRDFRPGADSEARDRGVRAFVPWGLYAEVGEWNFYPLKSDPTLVLDEHWYMTPYHVGRETYYQRPTYPLRLVNGTAEDFVSGPLEDWTRGALRFNGRDQYATVPNEELTKPFQYEVSYSVSDWATVTCPARMKPGVPQKIEVRLTDIPKGRKLQADLHWRKTDGTYAGMLTWGGPPQEVTGEGPYTFTFTPPDKPDLESYVLVLVVSTTGEFKDRTRMVTHDIPRGEAEGKTVTVTIGAGRATERRTAEGPDLKNPQVHNSNFLVEVYFRTAPGHTGGVLVQKMQGAGYALRVDAEGRVTFEVAWQDGRARVASKRPVNDGQWHHVVAEADRNARRLTLYVDGRRDAEDRGPGPDVSLANDGDFYVGGTPEGRCLNGAVDFLRVTLGTLADARTSIEELYEWEFNGPFLRDFCGRRPVDRRDAGAIECTGE